ncbi:MAG: homocysteine biosynthesis protein [Candidatus Bathyarchaeota archaeon]|jgi:uncharacterized protein (DUF39 family)/CBS domain-containing protein
MQSSKKRNGRTITEINQKIKSGDVQVVTAEEMKKLVESSGTEVAYKDIDVVTTGTFGAMCSSGAIINIGHSDPPIKIQRAWLNDVEVCHPGAAVDLYIGATMMSDTQPFEYGGGHVIEDLISGKEIEVRATAYGTDCYPRTKLDTTITKDDLNQFYLLNFRNCYQHYVCATNSRDEIIYTYMGKLLPKFRNATYSGAGSLNPLMNDPDYETIGIGTRIFLGGTQGYVIGEGTQHDPNNRFGTLMVRGDCKNMSTEFIRGGAFTKYGTSMYVGIGIPIPLLNEGMAKKTALRDEEILTDIVDYGIPRRGRPKLGKITYATLKSGEMIINDRKIKVSSLSSLKKAKKISEILKSWITNGTFYLSAPAETLPTNSVCNVMRQSKEIDFVSNVAHESITCRVDEEIKTVAERIISKSVNHVVVTDKYGEIKGIVTSWDLTRAIAEGKSRLADVITKKVFTTRPEETLEVASRKMAQHHISALPVLDNENRVVGLITSEDISKLRAR